MQRRKVRDALGFCVVPFDVMFRGGGEKEVSDRFFGRMVGSKDAKRERSRV